MDSSTHSATGREAACENRSRCLEAAAEYFDDGGFLRDLNRRVGFPTESDRNPDLAVLASYLRDEMAPGLRALGFSARLLPNPVDGAGPLLVASRVESPELPTVLLYGHGDVVSGNSPAWRAGLDPWQVVIEDDRWYGRGTADNKGQHTICLGGLAAALEARRGALGYNVKVLLESGEEAGSPGLEAFCAEQAGLLEADLFIGCDGPRIRADRPTLFLGSRGMVNFTLSLRCRERAFHSGNWGGVIRNPATVIASAVACLVDGRGVMQVAGLRAPAISDAVRAAVATLPIGGGEGDPVLAEGWGEPGLTPAERLMAWNTMEVLALGAGDADRPVNAIPARAVAHCQLRFVPGTPWQALPALVAAHLRAHGYGDVDVELGMHSAATRLDPADPWVHWCAESLACTTQRVTSIMPNLAGSIPNAAFSDVLGLPTLWIPHSYPACGQHGPNEHLLGSLAREGLQMMAGVFWDLGQNDAPWFIGHRRLSVHTA
ncbi:hypothetical protein CAL29_11680 [Bordetella genomosp. 10]|uniref:Peptidase M20 dimerisation domain-containing protein n=1 Tax=Bordetella genomosp. 10 TaxID=1416804 RepID=A0A261S9Y4_9BORD|nr:M20 family metallopeptidase [Bordetella genomosp. 10]OZI34199.1 hypothetical protein CAL29_11680 [Bordetella genomosp. 10]